MICEFGLSRVFILVCFYIMDLFRVELKLYIYEMNGQFLAVWEYSKSTLIPLLVSFVEEIA